VHFTEMVGEITVVPWGEEGVRTTGSPEEAVAAGEAQRDQIAAQLDAVVTELSTLDADSARAGSGSPDVPLGLVNMFGPGDLSISTGESVTWTVMGTHTISFNAPEDAFNLRLMQLDAVFGGEGIITNQKAAAPANSPGQTPDATGSPVLIDGGSWDGEGFISSGLIESSSEQVVQYRLTFDKAGTYNLQCLIHPGMEGTVKVGS
jgi:plastocyanin